MSNGLSVDQVSECRSETFSSIRRTDSINSGDSSDASASNTQGITVLGRSNQPINQHGNINKRPTSEKIAKDTGCCLYSAITFIVVMVVTLGIVLIIAGPVLGLSLFPPLLRTQPSAALIDYTSTMQHSNQSEMFNATSSAETYDHEASDHPDDYSDYLYENDDPETNGTDYYYSEKSTMDFNASHVNDTAEDLSKLSPEAWRQHPKYVAYVPIPVNEDEEDEDGPLLHKIDHEQDRNSPYYSDDDDDHGVSSQKKHSVKEKVLLPIVMVPSGTSYTHEVAVSPDGGASAASVASHSRRYEQDEGSYESSETLVPSPSRRVPNRNEERVSSAAYQQLLARHRNRERNRHDKKKLYAYLRAPARQQNVNKRVEGLRYPPRYIRPPPVRPRNRIQQGRFHETAPLWSIREPERPRPTEAPKKPIYSYPRDAMSIQDIINYMTSLGSSTEAPSRANPVHSNQVSAVNRAVWSPEPVQQPYRPRDRPSIIPASYIAHSKQFQVNRAREPPYSFKLDVYPAKDAPGGGRDDGYSSNNRGVTASYSGFNPYHNHPRYRQNEQHQRGPPVLSRQRPQEAPTLGHVDLAYKVRFQDQHRPEGSFGRPEGSFGQPSRPRPPSSFRDEYHGDVGEFTRPRNPRPRPVQPARDQALIEKPKVVVHLNVYNQKNHGDSDYARYDNRNADEDEEEDETTEDEDYFYSPSDIYKAVLRNNAVRRNKNLKGIDDAASQSRRSDQNERQEPTYSPDSAGHQDNLYRNHNMAVTDHYYRSLSSTASGSSNRNTSRYRSTSIRNRSSQDDDDPEPLPLPVPHVEDHHPATEAPPSESTTIDS